MDSTEPATATVTRGGKLHLPSRVIKNLNVKEGDQLVFYMKPGRALVVPMAAALTKQTF
jgi:bifunctional DNA-binding transcriptional regulator/antitoxin component of YhaV-PrlF toxin-antitoxin module